MEGDNGSSDGTTWPAKLLMTEIFTRYILKENHKKYFNQYCTKGTYEKKLNKELLLHVKMCMATVVSFVYENKEQLLGYVMADLN